MFSILFSLVSVIGFVHIVHSYFEKGCRKKCTQQSRNGLWVVLSLLFFEEIWKNGTRGLGRLFASTEGKQQKYVRQLSTSGIVHWPYPIFPFGIVACTFFPTFLEIAVYCIFIKLHVMVLRGLECTRPAKLIAPFFVGAFIIFNFWTFTWFFL